MKKVIVKVLISIFFGLVVGQSVGYCTQHITYFYLKSSQKWEVNEFEYSKQYPNESKIEFTFNKKNFWFTSLLSTSILGIALLYKELKE